MADITLSEVVLQNQLETPKSSHASYTLPCGYLSDAGELHAEVSMHEMTGREEDILASNKLSPQRKINQVLINCVDSIGSISDKNSLSQIIPGLPTGDRVFLVVALRRVSLGDDFPVEDQCPSCSAKNGYILDLSQLETKSMPDPYKRVFDVTLPSGRSVRFRVGSGLDEERLAKVSEGDRPTMALLCRIEVLDGKAPTIESVKGLSFRDRQHLRLLYQEVDGGVDTSLELTCPACAHTFEREMDMSEPGFFFPERVLKDLKMKSST